MSIASPSYYRAQSAISHLESGGDIAPYNEGFEELGGVLLQPLRESNPPGTFEKIRLERIRPKQLSSVHLSGVVQKFDLGIVALFSNNQEIDYRLSETQPRVDTIKKKDLLCLAISVFAFGIILQIAGFTVEWRAARRRAA